MCPRDGIADGGQVIDDLTFADGEVRHIRDAKGVGIGGHDITFSSSASTTSRCTTPATADVHNECMYLSEVPGFTLKNNAFIRCPTMAVFFTNWHVSDYGDVTGRGRRVRPYAQRGARRGTRQPRW